MLDNWTMLMGGTPPSSPKAGDVHGNRSSAKPPRQRSAGLILVRRREDSEISEALLIHREDKKDGLLEVPKGHIEHGEASVAAAERKCREKTALISQIKMLGKLTPNSYLIRPEVTTSHSTQVTEIQKIVDMYVFESNEFGGKIEFKRKDVREGSTRDLRWLTADEIKRGAPVMERWHSAVLEALDMAHHELIQGRLVGRQVENFSENLVTPGQEVLLASATAGSTVHGTTVDSNEDSWFVECAAIGVGVAVVGMFVSSFRHQR